MARFVGLFCLALIAVVSLATASWDGVTSVTRTSVAPTQCANAGCPYDCSASYTVAVVGDSLFLAPPSTSVGACTCYSTALNISGSTATGIFPDGTTALVQRNGDSVTVVAGGQCTGTYSTAGPPKASGAAIVAPVAALGAVVVAAMQ